MAWRRARSEEARISRVRPSAAEDHPGQATASILVVAFDVLRDGLNLTQPFRHGQAHDEFATITGRHYTALTELDQYPVSDPGAGTWPSVDEAVVRTYRDHAEQFRAFDLQDRLEEPEPDDCPECWRPTCLAVSWDDFGVRTAPGVRGLRL